MNNKENGKNGTLIIVLLAIVAILVFFFPTIYDKVTKITMPKVENGEKEKVEEKKIDEEILELIHYPLMRNSVYNPNTYYSKDVFKMSDLSNADILYNGFLDIYEGNMTSHSGVGACTNISKQFSTEYLTLRIKNILGRNLKYTFTDFTVPQDSSSKYVGTWKYDSANARYIYQGVCQNNTSNVKYYNLEELIKVEYAENQRDILVYYYVGFAKVEGNNYIIYKDANMTEKISEGTFKSVEDLNSEYKKLNKKQKRVYKYTFKNTLCSYNEYCLYEGKWTNEL